MPTATPVRTVKVSETDETYDPYTTLIAAILARAVADAAGQCSPSVSVPHAQLQAEAVAWLSDDAQVAPLVELTGLDSAPVLRRIRQLLAELPPILDPPQLSLFGGAA